MVDSFMQIARDSWGLIPLMIVILMIGLAVSIERLYYFKRNIHSGLNVEHDLQTIEDGNLEKTRQLAEHYENSIQGKFVSAALPLTGSSVEVLDRALEQNIMFQLPKVDRNLWVLDTCVTLGPLMGLLGTIIHMIEAFSVLSSKMSQGAHSVTGPIAHALIATAMGLCIAIVCVIFLNLFNKRVRALLLQLELIKSMLISRLARTSA